MIKLKKITPFLLSAVWVFLALWIELAPKTLGTSTELIHNFFKRIDYLAYDTKLLARLGRVHMTPYPIAIIAIDDYSIQQEGRWPWSYAKISNLIAKLREQRTSVIVSDLLFNELEPNMVTLIEQQSIKNPLLIKALDKIKPEFDDNAKLIQQIKNKHDVVLPYLLYKAPFTQGTLPTPLIVLNRTESNSLSILKTSGYITNFPSLQRVSEHNGFLSTLTDEDGVIRRTPLVLRYQDKIYPSLALAVASVLLPNDPIKLNEVNIDGNQYLDSILIGKHRIPTDSAGRVFIPYLDKSHSFKYYSATDVLSNKLKANELKQKVVFIGTTASAFADFSATPVDRAMPNIEVQANILSGILDGDIPHLAYWAKAATIGLVVGIGIMLTISLPLLSPGLSILLATFILISLFVLNIWLWIAKSIVFSFSAPVMMTVMLVLTNMTYGFLFESRKKKFLREVFGQYISPEYVNILLDNPDKYSLDGESIELSVLFADIRHFTTMTEHLDASEVKRLLNQFFSPMTQIIFNHGGTINK